MAYWMGIRPWEISLLSRSQFEYCVTWIERQRAELEKEADGHG